ncbi:MAG: hypothetical protein ACM30G_12455, partial [Micromonosporaceae bacterium]
LTVGPLPAAVYWRRRGVVLVGVLLMVVGYLYACGGWVKPSAGASRPSPTRLHPIIGATPTPSATAFTLPGLTVPCADEEMQVSAAATPAQVPYRTPVALTITFRNVSARGCERNIGADVQELRILSGGTLIWSSDDCNPNHGNNVSTFNPGQETTFTFTWNGRMSRTGTGTVTCQATAPAPQPGAYQVIGRLGDKLSDPFTLRLT